MPAHVRQRVVQAAHCTVRVFVQDGMEEWFDAADMGYAVMEVVEMVLQAR